MDYLITKINCKEDTVEEINSREIVIDECVYSKKLMRSLKKKGINATYLGNRKKDSDIERYVIGNNALFVTADEVFDTHFGWNQSFMLQPNDSLAEKVRLIKAFVDDI